MSVLKKFQPAASSVVLFLLQIQMDWTESQSCYEGIRSLNGVGSPVVGQGVKLDDASWPLFACTGGNQRFYAAFRTKEPESLSPVEQGHMSSKDSGRSAASFQRDCAIVFVCYVFA